MKTALRIALFSVRDVLRSKWGILYMLFFFLATEGLFRLQGDTSQVTISLIGLSLILIPLTSIIFGTMYIYYSREFIELLVTQPVRRRTVFGGMYTGLTFSLITAFVVGVITPFVLRGAHTPAEWSTLALLLTAGSCLTTAFVGLSFYISLLSEDRGKGLGIAIFVWLATAVLYDGVIMIVAYAFASYPLETPMLILAMLNPIDMARVFLLIKVDMAALMGYTGAVFERFFGGSQGALVSIAVLLLWTVLPFWAGLRRFARKDF